ncbi:MAG: hypothetical protein IT324_23540 [Anaerolineae bacterium]|nr:hypothetical protein [Anaerolineae bacterium]
MNWQDEVTAIINDKRSGAFVLSSAVANALIHLANEATFTSVDDLLAQLNDIGEHVLQSQTGMAPLVGLYNRVLFAVGSQVEVTSALAALRDTAQAYLNEQQHNSAELSRRAVALMPSGITVATYSASSTVLAAFKWAAKAGRQLSVICHESRPGFEGRHLASELAAANVEVTLTADAAMYENVRASELVIIGADSMSDKGIVGKLGTAALVTCAKWLGVPCYVLADTNKIWPSALGSQPIKERSPQEIWDDAPRGVKIINHYYDVASWDAVSGVVTEQGLLTDKEIRQQSRQRAVNPGLQNLIARIRSDVPVVNR